METEDFNKLMRKNLDVFLNETVRLIDRFNEENDIGVKDRTQVLLFTTLSSCRFILGHTYKIADSYMEDIINQAKEIKKNA